MKKEHTNDKVLPQEGGIIVEGWNELIVAFTTFAYDGFTKESLPYKEPFIGFWHRIFEAFLFLFGKKSWSCKLAEDTIVEACKRHDNDLQATHWALASVLDRADKELRNDDIWMTLGPIIEAPGTSTAFREKEIVIWRINTEPEKFWIKFGGRDRLLEEKIAQMFENRRERLALLKKRQEEQSS
jgi:hypothetical protein